MSAGHVYFLGIRRGRSALYACRMSNRGSIGERRIQQVARELTILSGTRTALQLRIASVLGASIIRGRDAALTDGNRSVISYAGEPLRVWRRAFFEQVSYQIDRTRYRLVLGNLYLAAADYIEPKPGGPDRLDRCGFLKDPMGAVNDVVERLFGVQPRVFRALEIGTNVG